LQKNEKKSWYFQEQKKVEGIFEQKVSGILDKFSLLQFNV